MGRWGAERARGKKTSSHSAGIREEGEGRTDVCWQSQGKEQKEVLFLSLDGVFALSPNSWINLEANRLPDVPALSG